MQSELTSIPVTSRISLSFKNKSNKGAAAAAASSSPGGPCGGGDGNNASGSRTTAMAVNGGTLESIVALESADPAAATATASDVTTSLTVPVEGETFLSFPSSLLLPMNGQLDETLNGKPNKPAGISLSPAGLSISHMAVVAIIGKSGPSFLNSAASAHTIYLSSLVVYLLTIQHRRPARCRTTLLLGPFFFFFFLTGNIFLKKGRQS